MKRIIFAILIAIPTFSQCQNIPNWVNNPPKSKDKIYAVGVGNSGSADIAERKARMDANVKLAEQVEPAVYSYSSKIDTILIGNKMLIERFNVVRKKVVATLHNTQEVEKIGLEKNGTYTTYVLLSMSKKDINRSLVSLIDEDKDLKAALSKSSAYKKMVQESK